MKATFARRAAPLGRARRASMLGFLLTLLASGSVSAQGAGQSTPGSARPAPPMSIGSVPGEISNAGATATA